MNGYVTYSIPDISGLHMNASMMHTKIEKILEIVKGNKFYKYV